MSFNTFGKIFRFTTWGESHGPAIGCVIDGCPPNIPISEKDIQKDMDRRRPGQSKFTTQRKESDKAIILSGVFEGTTTGTPISIIIHNEDKRSRDYETIKNKFRPGHADYTYFKKYGIRDFRGGGRASARETVMRVAGGAIAKKVLEKKGVIVRAGVMQIGDIVADSHNFSDVSKNDFNFVDKSKVKALENFFKELIKDQDSIGAKIIVNISGLQPGVGSPVFSKLDAELAKSLMSVNAVKAIEIGTGVDSVTMRGSENRDIISVDGFETNNSGGILGGISNGDDINIFTSLKPTSSISQKTTTTNIDNQKVDLEVKGRHDPCVGIRAVPIAEAMVSLVLVDHLLINRAQCSEVKQELPFSE